MKLSRWLTVILTIGSILVLTAINAEADPYDHPHGRAHGWERHHRPCYSEQVIVAPPTVAYVAPPTVTYVAPPPVAYVTPAPVVPCPPQPQSQLQLNFSNPLIPGLSGQLLLNR